MKKSYKRTRHSRVDPWASNHLWASSKLWAMESHLAFHLQPTTIKITIGTAIEKGAISNKNQEIMIRMLRDKWGTIFRTMTTSTRTHHFTRRNLLRKIPLLNLKGMRMSWNGSWRTWRLNCMMRRNIRGRNIRKRRSTKIGWVSCPIRQYHNFMSSRKWQSPRATHSPPISCH